MNSFLDWVLCKFLSLIFTPIKTHCCIKNICHFSVKITFGKLKFSKASILSGHCGKAPTHMLTKTKGMQQSADSGPAAKTTSGEGTCVRVCATIRACYMTLIRKKRSTSAVAPTVGASAAGALSRQRRSRPADTQCVKSGNDKPLISG